MKNQALFSSKDKSKKIKMLSAAIFVWHFKGQNCYMLKYMDTKVNKINNHYFSFCGKLMVFRCPNI